MTLALPITEELLEALAGALEERLRERRRWADINGVAEYLNPGPHWKRDDDASLEQRKRDVRYVRQLREKGLPAKPLGKRLLFDLREVDAWLEREEWT